MQPARVPIPIFEVNGTEQADAVHAVSLASQARYRPGVTPYRIGDTE